MVPLGALGSSIAGDSVMSVETMGGGTQVASKNAEVE